MAANLPGARTERALHSSFSRMLPELRTLRLEPHFCIGSMCVYQPTCVHALSSFLLGGAAARTHPGEAPAGPPPAGASGTGTACATATTTEPAPCGGGGGGGRRRAVGRVGGRIGGPGGRRYARGARVLGVSIAVRASTWSLIKPNGSWVGGEGLRLRRRRRCERFT